MSSDSASTENKRLNLYSVVALFASFITVPIERIICLKTTDQVIPRWKNQSKMSYMKDLYRLQGNMAGLYRGFPPIFAHYVFIQFFKKNEWYNGDHLYKFLTENMGISPPISPEREF